MTSNNQNAYEQAVGVAAVATSGNSYSPAIFPLWNTANILNVNATIFIFKVLSLVR